MTRMRQVGLGLLGGDSLSRASDVHFSFYTKYGAAGHLHLPPQGSREAVALGNTPLPGPNTRADFWLRALRQPHDNY
jgi:hypothetical protein